MIVAEGGRFGGYGLFLNLKAEVEIMALHEKLDRIRLEHLEGVLQAQTKQIEGLTGVVRCLGAVVTDQ